LIQEQTFNSRGEFPQWGPQHAADWTRWDQVCQIFSKDSVRRQRKRKLPILRFDDAGSLGVSVVGVDTDRDPEARHSDA
jgi:hypothetical protein